MSLTFHFDFADPVSRVLDVWLRAEGVDVTHAAFEFAPPPGPGLDPSDRAWLERWEAAAATSAELGGLQVLPPRPPRVPLVPWTRKAHELVCLADEHGLACEARTALFVAFLDEGRDIGRVDVLVDVGVALGLDFTETKATLDVDRFAADIERARAAAASRGVVRPATLTRKDERLEAPAPIGELRRFLGEAAREA
ncbi:MAG: hypothetical protein D6701_03930 [Gemmatimonadetes bacterium]|nr:MAG: hypothetical protein D6701_03930 [Gemmatimonadota bacterium]